MCGLIGIAGPATYRMDDTHCSELVERVEHRGPDASTYLLTQDYMLGHTRLAIQDLSPAAGQPFEADHITLTYNGELWNADQIEVGPRKTHGDTEVVAKALARYGEAALERFDGMWAMVWHNSEDGMIRIARDRWGKVPLYVGTDGASVYWASEYRALEPRLVEQTPILPGHVVTIDPQLGWIIEDRHWAKDNPLIPEPADPEHVLALLRKGVAERLVGDRSIAFLLSGGLDSTLILALARELYTGDVVAYTAVMNPDSPDLAAARWVAEHYGVELVEVHVPLVTNPAIRRAVQAIEIPMKAQVEIALAHLPVMEQIAKDGHAVCLSGEAADELFGGYGNMQIAASSADDAGYQAVKLAAVDKMSRGNFPRVNKVGMAYGVECRLPFMQSDLVELALAATKDESPPGKGLLKEAAAGLVPEKIIKRQKETFQGGVGTAAAAETVTNGAPAKFYNQIARELFGFIPRS